MSTRFGRYDLLHPLGKGGMAEVYLARYAGPEGFEKQLVIKRVLPKLADNPRLLRMFFEEAKTQVSFSHGNLVSVFDFGRVGNDYFIAMEYVRGVDLASLLSPRTAADNTLPANLVAHIGVELCRGLAYVHRRGFVHRDVSPRNVLLSVDGEVKLSDFGLALAVESQVTAGLRGTLSYMAPEQARGDRLDARADLYALGMILTEALIGRRPQPGEPPISEREPLAPVLTRAIREAADERFASAEEMLAALEQELVGLAAARQSLVQDLAAKVGSLSPNVDSSEPAFPRSATAATSAEASNAQDSYFRDQRSRNFVEEVLRPPGPVRSFAARILGPLVGVAVLALGVFIVKVATAVPPPVAKSDSPIARPQQTPPQLPLAAPSNLVPATPEARAAPKSTRPVRAALDARARTPVAVPLAGEIKIHCTPWCVPYLDGKAMANDGRSFVLRDVSPGRHRIEGRRLDDRQQRDIDVGSGGHEAVEFQFD